MPLVKRPNGWYWGSKGPFDSKTKALAVARAAYANGYKGESDTSVISDDSSHREIVQEYDPKIPRLMQKNISA